MIAYDVGATHRQSGWGEARVDQILLCVEGEGYDLLPIEKWLSTLTDEQLETVCIDEQTEAEDILAGPNVPELAGEVLNRIWELI
jgi:hypothetical protein